MEVCTGVREPTEDGEALGLPYKTCSSADEPLRAQSSREKVRGGSGELRPAHENFLCLSRAIVRIK